MVTLLFTTLQLFHKKISYRTFWCIMNLAQNITKESDPVRQKHYTTKKHWLVDFINIFWFILKLFLFRQQIPYFCWYYLYWAAHNGSNYLNGHCFVRVMLCVPVWNGDKVSHLSLHIYRETGWENSESISDWSKQCFVFVACEEQDKEKLEEYITELHKKYKHKQNRD